MSTNFKIFYPGHPASTYDAFGRMVEQNGSGTYTQFAYSPTGFKTQILSGQTAQKSFVPLPAGAMAVYVGSTLTYIHPDWLGSARLGSTSSRTMSFDLAYAPFGETYAVSGSSTPSFTGQSQDTVAGLYDFPAREYSTQGRWPSPDPAGLASVDPSNPQSWNRYAYVRNNPLGFIDPSGLSECAPGEHDCNVGEGEGTPGEDIMGAPCCIDIEPPLDLGNALITTLILNSQDFVFSVTSVDNFPGDTINVTDMLNGSWGPNGPLHGRADTTGAEFSALQYQQYQGMRLLEGLTPTACGGGGFLFLGAQPKKGSAQGFVSPLLEWDSKSGWSIHGLFELGAHGAGGGVITNPLQGLFFLPLGEYAPYGVPVEVGALGATSGAVGAYGEVGKGKIGGGAGGYVNIDTRLSCGPG